MTIYSFDEILVDNAVLNLIKPYDRSAEEFLRQKFSGPSVGFNLEKIKRRIFSGRLNDKERIHMIFVEGLDGKKLPYIFAYDAEHNYGKILRSHPKINDITKVSEVEEGSLIPLQSNKVMIAEDEADKQPTGVSFLSRLPVILLDDDQEKNSKILYDNYGGSNQSAFVNSIAGSGKTVLALHHLAKIAQNNNGNPPLIYLTKSADLVMSQQILFARLYPDCVDKVSFISHDKFLKQDDKTIATYQDFEEWYGINKDKSIGTKKIGSEKVEVLYDELRHLVGNYHDAEGYKNAPPQDSAFKHYPEKTDSKKIDRSDIVELCSQYRQYLGKTKIDILDVRLAEIEDNQKHPVIVVDEAQQLTKKECDLLQTRSKTPLQYFGDSNQGPTYFHPKYLGNPQILKQQINYRSSNAVTKAANFALQKINEIGNFGDAAYKMEENPHSSDGSVEFVDDTKKINWQTINDNAQDYIVIVPSQDIKTELQKSCNAPVMTIKECHGLECKNVVLYQCFPPDKFSDRSKVVPTNTAGSKAKDKNNINFAELKFWRQIFSAATRSRESLVIINDQNKLVTEWRNQLTPEKPTKGLKNTSQFVNSGNAETREKFSLSQAANALNVAAKMKNENRNDEYERQLGFVLSNIYGLFTKDIADGKNEELKTKLINLLSDKFSLLAQNQSLCQAIIKGKNITEIINNIDSYSKFLPKETTGLDWDNIPKNLDPGLEIEETSILDIALQDDQDGKIILGLYQPIEWSSNTKKHFISALNDLLNNSKNLDPKKFSTLLEIILQEKPTDLLPLIDKDQGYNVIKTLTTSENPDNKNKDLLLKLAQSHFHTKVARDILIFLAENHKDWFVENFATNIPDNKGSLPKDAVSGFCGFIKKLIELEILDKKILDASLTLFNKHKEKTVSRATLLQNIIASYLGKKVKNLSDKDCKSFIEKNTDQKFAALVSEIGKTVIKKTTKQPSAVKSTEKKYNQGIYNGDFLGSVAHGKGSIQYNDDSFYEGDFLNGIPHGRGTQKMNGDVYEGEFLNGSATGEGVLTESNGNVYEGEFMGGRPNGQGKYVYLDVGFCEGEWENGDFKTGRGRSNHRDYEVEVIGSKGVIKYSDGDVYEGECVAGNPSGQGKMVYPNGDFCEGKWLDGEFVSGEVKKTFDDYCYEGGWKNGTQHGTGKTYLGETTRIGEWSNGKPVDSIMSTIRRITSDVLEGIGIIPNSNTHLRPSTKPHSLQSKTGQEK